MTKTYEITDFQRREPGKREFITKFGGQPDWIRETAGRSYNKIIVTVQKARKKKEEKERQRQRGVRRGI